MHLLAVLLLAFDLSAVQNEPNPEKRSDLALKNADQAVTSARDAYQAGDPEKLQAALDEARQSIDICYTSLEASGKDPRGSRYYKQAELATRQILRRVEGLKETMSVVDKDVVEPLRLYLVETHDKILTSIMAKKKK